MIVKTMNLKYLQELKEARASVLTHKVTRNGFPKAF